jgi:pantoate--beta-alanine ligase|tara:strand:+ start:3272 stop:4102 length:831 start_codon:yes stop_codon:yes gene_type:complete
MAMQVVHTVEEIKQKRLEFSQRKIGFVPTMGALHEGHLALVKKCKSESELSIVSIFVNPTQFNDNKDLEKYPNTIEADLKSLEQMDVDIVFIPNFEDLYQNEQKLTVNIAEIEQKMEGSKRPGHFDGVIRVLSIFFNLIKPKYAYFGEKDYQQVLVVQQLINQHFPTISLIKCPTIREHNGLAKSSRNKLLSESAFNRSGEIYSTLKWIKENITAQSINSILDDGMRKLSERFEVEYLELRNENNLEETSNSLENSRLFVAVQIESIRLIDNIALN